MPALVLPSTTRLRSDGVDAAYPHRVPAQIRAASEHTDDRDAERALLAVLGSGISGPPDDRACRPGGGLSGQFWQLVQPPGCTYGRIQPRNRCDRARPWRV